MSEIFLSILIVTRKRFDYHLTKTLDSLISNASKLDDIEILLRIDEDDTDTISKLDKLPKNIIIRPIIGKRYGYKSMPHYFGDLVKESRGQFLFLFPDDFEMLTQNWDKYIRKHENQICIIYPEAICILVVHRFIIETYMKILNNGQISEHYAIDSIYLHIAKSLGIFARYSAIQVKWNILNGENDPIREDLAERHGSIEILPWAWKQDSKHLNEVIETLRPCIDSTICKNHVLPESTLYTTPLSPIYD